MAVGAVFASAIVLRAVAWAILHPAGTARIAEHYYRRLDRSSAAAGAEAAEKDVSA